MKKTSGIGGQAVMEGIMMRAGEKYSISARRPDGGIETTVRDFKSVWPSKAVRKVPILRGAVAFIDSMIVGVSSIMWSADVAAMDDEETENAKTEEEKKKEETVWNVAMTLTVIASLALSIGLFVLLPYFLAGILRKAGVHETIVSVAEALLRIVVFLLYMFLISRLKDIQRVFAYHGAEHKCINCVENGLDLTVENVLASSRLHKRCGTSFLLIVILISVVAFLILGLFGIKSGAMRILLRLILVPVIAGVSFEVLQASAKSESRLVCALTKPGLALQKLVTREPDAEMAEVAITAVEAVFDWRAFQGKDGGGE